MNTQLFVAVVPCLSLCKVVHSAVVSLSGVVVLGLVGKGPCALAVSNVADACSPDARTKGEGRKTCGELFTMERTESCQT